jgi:hypothetical protein
LDGGEESRRNTWLFPSSFEEKSSCIILSRQRNPRTERPKLMGSVEMLNAESSAYQRASVLDQTRVMQFCARAAGYAGSVTLGVTITQNPPGVCLR